jgi:hypothetical protein
MYNFNKPKMSSPKKSPMAPKSKGAASIIAMLKKLPQGTLTRVYKYLEKMEPEDVPMAGTRLQRKYPGE